MKHLSKSSFIIAIIFCTLLIFITGCPGKKTSQTGQANPPPNHQENTVKEQDNQTERTAQTSAGELLDPTLKPPVTGYQPTKEQPLAPPAPPAAGTEAVPEGEVKLVASAKGIGDELIPLQDNASVTVVDKLLIQISVVNNTPEKKEFTFATAQKLDVLFTDADGNEKYLWSRHHRFPQVINTLSLEPGQTWSHEITIPIGTGEGKLKPGMYNVVVMLTGTPAITAQALNVTIKGT